MIDRDEPGCPRCGVDPAVNRMAHEALHLLLGELRDAQHLLDMSVPAAIRWLKESEAAQGALHEVLGLPAPGDVSVRKMLAAERTAREGR